MIPLESAQYILENDNYSKFMGIKIIEIKENYCLIEMQIKEEMWNGIGTVHGGVTFSFAETALAFSSMSNGKVSVALNCVINFTRAVKKGDVLRAESKLFYETKKTAIFDIEVRNQNQEVVAGFRGTTYKIDKNLKD